MRGTHWSKLEHGIMDERRIECVIKTFILMIEMPISYRRRDIEGVEVDISAARIVFTVR